MHKNTISFKKRITPFWVYPKLCSYQDNIDNAKHFFGFLNEQPTDDLPIRIYIHIPFCMSCCFFCPFYKENYRAFSYEAKKTFFEAMKKELEMYSKSKLVSGRTISTINFGGGDPSCVEIEFLKEIFDCIKENYNLSECEQITIEGNVLSLLDEEKLKFFKEMNVGRISFGVQTFNPILRKKLLLRPTIEDIEKVVEMLRKNGHDDFSFDLMYNIPDQTDEDIVNDIEKAVTLNPTYIDEYNMVLYENTKFKDLVFNSDYFKIKPSDSRELHMLRLVMDTMKKHEYNQVLGVNFSKTKIIAHRGVDEFLKGFPMLGIGPSARGYLEGRNYRNVCSVEKYIDRINEGTFPSDTGNIASSEEQEERIMVFFPALTKIHREDIPNYEKFEPKINAIINSGYASWKENMLELTDEGKLWAGNIQQFFCSNEQIKKGTLSYLKTLKQGGNLYNQDFTGTKKA